MAIDVHCHLNDEAFDNDYMDIVGNFSADNIDYAIVSGYDLQSSLKAIDIARLSDNVYAAIGFHPENVDDYKNGDFERLLPLYKDEKVVAVGEIGLDYHYEPYDEKKQKEFFLKQLEIANEVLLPVVIHQRDCGMDILNILKENRINAPVVLHCFSESLEMCKEFLKLGCYISIGGVVTYKNAGKLLDVAKYVPTYMLLTETDCPYLSPVPMRGKRNEPKNVNYVTAKIAELRGITKEELEKDVLLNFKRIFTKIK